MRSTTSLSVFVLPPVLLIMAGLAVERPQNPHLDSSHTIEANLNVPSRIHDLLGRACYDCHSSETHWPWYSTLPPVSRMILSDVQHGREALNFSEWLEGPGASKTRAGGTLLAACGAMQQHIMPKNPYPLLHPEARLKAEDIQFFCDWAHAQAKELKR